MEGHLDIMKDPAVWVDNLHLQLRGAAVAFPPLTPAFQTPDFQTPVTPAFQEVDYFEEVD